jgi:rSAM/selenodomain-associated transferase 1
MQTIPPPPQRLLVFARLPELGRVKTRLARDIGDERALAIYEAMLQELLGSIGPSNSDREIEVMWAPSDEADGELLARVFPGRSVAMQTGEELGDRLAMAFSERFFFHRTKMIVAIGVDDPRLSRELIDHAFGLLESCEWVLGPADDGGYYLIGCRAPTFDVEIFRGIEWGTSSVFETTMSRIREWNQTVALLPVRYDLDVAADLRRYAADVHDGSVARLLDEWGWRT